MGRWRRSKVRKGGAVILWDLKKKVELKEGQALFFPGRIIMHNACRNEGWRNSVDLFIHKSLLKMDQKKKRHSGNVEGSKKRKRKSSFWS